jgi:Tfp pilus assembly protein PilZ
MMNNFSMYLPFFSKSAIFLQKNCYSVVDNKIFLYYTEEFLHKFKTISFAKKVLFEALSGKCKVFNLLRST